MTFIQRTASALDLFQNVRGPSRPDEGLGVFVVAVGVISHGPGGVFPIAKNSPAPSVFGEVAEETFHHVQPRRTGGGEVHMKTWVPLEPALNLGVFVGGVVVADQV